MSYDHKDISLLSRTQLKTYLDSPIDFYHIYKTGRMAAPVCREMLLGSVCHAVLLEDVPLEKAFAVYPDSCLKSDGSINGKPAKQFREDNPDVIGFGKADEAKNISDALWTVCRHELGRLIKLASQRETQLTGEYNGRGIKCKPDFVCDSVIYDLKFMEDVSDAQLKRSFKRFKYWLQDAHYSACVGDGAIFRFWVVETKFPYRIKARYYDPRSREIAKEAWELAMDKFIEAERNDDWTEKESELMTINPWDVDANDDGELVEMGEAS